MKNLFIIKSALHAILTITTVLILGMFVPFIITILVYWCDDIYHPLTWYILSAPFLIA